MTKISNNNTKLIRTKNLFLLNQVDGSELTTNSLCGVKTYCNKIFYKLIKNVCHDSAECEESQLSVIASELANVAIHLSFVLHCITKECSGLPRLITGSQ
jgi:hypothetical protein